MEIVALMSGAKGEKAHQLYKEEDENHKSLCYDLMFYILWSIQTCLSLQLFSEDCSVV